MTLPPTSRTAQHLMHLIVTRNGDVPNFSLLLGSGASATSNVVTAREMIARWRSILFERFDGNESQQEWLDTQPWFEHEDEYSLLFEMVYDQPSQRRVYIEECLKEARPGWGYVYLTSLLSERFFDVVFTTNFDDLMNEACYLYSHALRPLVAAHDSAIQGIRVTSGRPKIIKLHGDFLYDNIKNTLSELQTLETNTKNKLHQFAQEYGLVVLGYSGRDRSVMDTLELLLRDGENYKQGVYWCLRRGERPSQRLESLLRKDRVYLVESDGFDQFAAELHHVAQLSLPKPIAQPFEMARERAELFVEIDEELKGHRVIGAHVKEVLKEIDTRSPKLPLTMEASILTSMGRLKEAIPIWKQALEEDLSNQSIAYHYAETLAEAGENDELAIFVPKSPLVVFHQTYYLLRAGMNQEVIEIASEYLAKAFVAKNGHSEGDDRALTRINRAIALKRLGRTEDMMGDLDFLEKNRDTANVRIKAGVAALRGDKEGMLDAIQGSFTHKELTVYPVFEDYRADPDFLALVTLEEEEASNG